MEMKNTVYAKTYIRQRRKLTVLRRVHYQQTEYLLNKNRISFNSSKLIPIAR